ncbi:MAG: alpha/beta fold hydrolase [Lachnospiraceae bacterium]|nr:alpha/beta fold hydrolase [Lachnospiraceae bacterium]
MMIKENYSFVSTDDVGTKVHGVCWCDGDGYRDYGGEPVAVLQLVHGMIEYIERYEEFAAYLVDRGFAVTGHDHIGHGHSVGKLCEAEWGIMHCDRCEEVMVEDMLTNYKLTRQRYPHVPHFILGHSMGSYLLRMFLAEKANEIRDLKGAMILGTGTVPDPMLHLADLIIRTASLIRGRDYKSPLVTGILFSGDYRKFDMDGSNPKNSWLSTNVESVKRYYKDPMNTYLFSLNGLHGNVRMIYHGNQIRNIRKIRRDLPVLFASGSDDPVGSLGKGVKKVYRKFQKAGLFNLTLKLYEGDRHEILQELDRDRVFEELYLWMKAQME